MSRAFAVLLVVVAGCSHDEPTMAARGATPVVPAAAPPSVLDDGWMSALAPRCLPELTLRIPAGDHVVEIPLDEDRCITSVQDATDVLVNIERSTADVVQVREGLLQSYGGPLTHDEQRANGWLLEIGSGPVTYAHRADLRITCMSLRGDPELTDRVCRSAAPTMAREPETDAPR